MLSRIEKVILERCSKGKLRSLQKPTVQTSEQIASSSSSSRLIDFSSNDYLGLSRNIKLYQSIQNNMPSFHRENRKYSHVPIMGSSGSRLLTGDNSLYHETELFLANFHKHKYALLCNSGWDLNFGILSSISSSDTIIIFDELSHNSIVIGTKLGRQAQTMKFKHNDLNHLQQLLDQTRKTRGPDAEILIVVESVYSMDGDICPLVNLFTLANQYNAMILADEAHSTGIYGSQGEGLVTSLGLNQHACLLGVVHTFGKAVGQHGAALLTSHESVIQYLLNYAHPIIYSTSLPVHSLISIRAAYEYMATAQAERESLFDLVETFKQESKQYDSSLVKDVVFSDSPIQALVVPGNENVLQMALGLRKEGFLCFPIRAPTVELGKERLRIVLHVHNTKTEIKNLFAAMHRLYMNHDVNNNSTLKAIPLVDSVSTNKETYIATNDTLVTDELVVVRDEAAVLATNRLAL